MTTLKLAFTLTVEDDMTIPTFGTAIEGLPEEDDTPIEKLADELSDKFAAAVKARNEQMFRDSITRSRS